MFRSCPHVRIGATQAFTRPGDESAEYLRKEFPELRKRYWGMHFWARGYFVSTVGIDRDVIKTYVKKQVESQIREQQLQIWKDGSG